MRDYRRERMDRVFQALSALDLSGDHISVVAEQNPSAAAPYHNACHCFTVALNALAGARYYKSIYYRTKQMIFLAGLYHDYDHSAGELTDAENIARAVRGMRLHVGELEDFTAEETDIIASIIEATIQPGSSFTGIRTLPQAILCDADHMQYLEPDADVFTAGLSLEMKVPVTRETTKAFLSGYTPYTEWGAKRIPLSLPEPATT